jgi:hypothetical protein
MQSRRRRARDGWLNSVAEQGQVEPSKKPEIRISKSETIPNLELPKSETRGVSRLPLLDFEFVSGFEIRISGLSPDFSCH